MLPFSSKTLVHSLPSGPPIITLQALPLDFGLLAGKLSQPAINTKWVSVTLLQIWVQAFGSVVTTGATRHVIAGAMIKVAHITELIHLLRATMVLRLVRTGTMVAQIL